MIKTEFVKKPRRSILSTVLVIVLGASIIICGIALTLAVQKYRLLTLSRAIHHGKERIVTLKNQEETVSEMTAQIEQTKRRQAEVDSLGRSSAPVSSIVEEIVQTKPRAAQLQFINIQPDSIELIGTVPVNRIAVDFVRQLKNSTLLSDAELVELKTIDGAPGLAFTIVVRLTRSQPENSNRGAGRP